MSGSSFPAPPDPWPYGWEKARRVPLTLDQRALWWIGRARWLATSALAPLCGVGDEQITAALWRLKSQHCLLVRRRRVLLTNGGVERLASLVGLPPAELARWLGWSFDTLNWAGGNDDQIADRWFTAGQAPGAHRLAVLDLLGQAAEESRAMDLAFWQVHLETVLTEREVATHIGASAPRPDGYLAWRVRRRLRFGYFLELETGSQRPGAIAEKLRAYARYAASRQCRDAWGKLPCVVFICASAAHERRLAALSAAVNHALPQPVLVLLTHQGWLAGKRLVDAIWRAPGETPVPIEARTTLWGRDDAELMLLMEQWKQAERPTTRYRI